MSMPISFLVLTVLGFTPDGFVPVLDPHTVFQRKPQPLLGDLIASRIVGANKSDRRFTCHPFHFLGASGFITDCSQYDWKGTFLLSS